MDALPDYGECSERIANEAMIVEQVSWAEDCSFSLSQSGAAHCVTLAHRSEEPKLNWRPRISTRDLEQPAARVVKDLVVSAHK